MRRSEKGEGDESGEGLLEEQKGRTFAKNASRDSFGSDASYLGELSMKEVG
jgi:hypothetical protein